MKKKRGIFTREIKREGKQKKRVGKKLVKNMDAKKKNADMRREKEALKKMTIDYKRKGRGKQVR